MSFPPRRIRSLVNSFTYRLAAVVPVAEELAASATGADMGDQPTKALKAINEAARIAKAMTAATTTKRTEK